MGLYGYKNREPAFQAAGYKITPDEIDRYEQYWILFPSQAGTLATAAAGTSTQAKTAVVVNAICDYPRNLEFGVAGSSDMGGTWVLNGKDQFGESVSETVAIGTAANGGTTVGTMIFAQVTSGTYTFTSGAIGSGTPKVKYSAAEGTTKFGLPFRTGGTADVKNFVYKPAFVTTVINGGTLGAYVGTGGFSGFNNYVKGTAAIGTADVYYVLARPTYNADGDTRPSSNLSQI
jgi:hypothetical protein